MDDGPFWCLLQALQAACPTAMQSRLWKLGLLPNVRLLSVLDLRRTVFAGFLQPHSAFPIEPAPANQYRRTAWFWDNVYTAPAPVALVERVFQVRFVVMDGEAPPPHVHAPLPFVPLLVIPVNADVTSCVIVDDERVFTLDACPPCITTRLPAFEPGVGDAVGDHVVKCRGMAVSGELDAITSRVPCSPPPCSPENPDDEEESDLTNAVPGDGGILTTPAVVSVVTRLQCGASVGATMPVPEPVTFNPYLGSAWGWVS